MSDIVEFENSDIVEKGYYFCDSVGFKKVSFEPEKAQDLKKDTITVVLVEPSKLARIAEIGTSLAELQVAVDGNIQAFYPYEEQVCIVCDDEGNDLREAAEPCYLQRGRHDYGYYGGHLFHL